MLGLPVTYQIFALSAGENFCQDRCLYHSSMMHDPITLYSGNEQ